MARHEFDLLETAYVLSQAMQAAGMFERVRSFAGPHRADIAQRRARYIAAGRRIREVSLAAGITKNVRAQTRARGTILAGMSQSMEMRNFHA